MKKIFNSFGAVLGGMQITLRYLIDPRTRVTQHYPENRDHLLLPARVRGRVVLRHNVERTQHQCTGCGSCQRACPNGTISVQTGKDPQTGKRALERFIYRFGRCMMCNLCVEACPYDALRMAVDFEHAVFDRRDLVQQLNEPGARLSSQPILEASLPERDEQGPWDYQRLAQKRSR